MNWCIPVPEDLTDATLEVPDRRRARKLDILMVAPYPTRVVSRVGATRWYNSVSRCIPVPDDPTDAKLE